MSKNRIQDIVKIKHSSEQLEVERDTPIFNSRPIEVEKTRGRYGLWIVAAISLVFFLFALSYMFLRVQVTVNPKVSSAIINQSFSASKDAKDEALLFDLTIISGEETKEVESKQEQDVLKKAQGAVVIYNNFSTTPQRLDVDTRLEGSNGKIYKTERSLVVPGMIGSTPGSIEVGIYGAEAGTEYNSGPLDFKIFGFKDTPKYAKFYARSKGAIAGGFKGKTYIIPDGDKASITNELKTALEAKLLKKATDQIPSGFILFKSAVVVNIDENNIDTVTSDKDTLPVKMKGTLYGFLFNEAKLTEKITEKNEGDSEDSIYLSNIRDLSFAFENSFSSAQDLKDVNNISFNLKGNSQIVSKVDEAKLASDLLGKSKKDFNQVLEQYPDINSASLVIKPFWKMSFPDKLEDINIIVNYPK